MFFIRSNARALASIDKKIINYTTPNKVKRFQFQSSNWDLGASCRTGPESAPPPQSRRALGSPGVGVAAPEVRMRHAHGPNGHQPENTAAHPAAFPFFGWRVTAFFFPHQKSENLYIYKHRTCARALFPPRRPRRVLLLSTPMRPPPHVATSPSAAYHAGSSRRRPRHRGGIGSGMTMTVSFCRVAALVSLLAAGAATALLTFSLPSSPGVSTTRRTDFAGALPVANETPPLPHLSAPATPPPAPLLPPPAVRPRKREVSQGPVLCPSPWFPRSRSGLKSVCTCLFVISRRTGGWRRRWRCATPRRRYGTPSRWSTTPTFTRLCSRTSPSSRGNRRFLSK